MKKLLLALLLIPSFSFADTITSGSVGLIQPSTGTVPTRNWGDSTNSNWQVIANTFTTVLNTLSTISSDTSTVITLLKSTSVALSNHINTYNTFTSTTQSDLEVIRSSMVAIRQSTSTLQSNFYAFTSTTQADLDVIRSSMVVIRQSTSSLASSFYTFTSTTQADFETIRSSVVAIRQSTSSIESTLAGRTQVWNDEGVALSGGDVKSVNCVGGLTCTQSNSTVTVTVAAGGGTKPFQIIVGTVGSNASEVDIASSNVDGLYEALRRLGAMGLTYSTTAQGTILYRAGTYNMSGATIPAGITVYAVPGSSVVWVPTSASLSIVTVYGKLRNVYFDFNGLAYASRGVTISGEAEVSGFRSYASLSMANNGALFFMLNATNSYVQGEMYDLLAKAVADGSKKITAFTAYYSSNSIIEIKTHNATYGSGEGVINIDGCKNLIFRNSYFEDMEQSAIAIDSSNIGIRFENSVFNFQEGTCSAVGCIILSAASSASSGGSHSTMTAIVDNTFIHSTNDTGPLIYIAQTASRSDGTLVSGNRVIKTIVGAAPIFVKVAAAQVGTILMNNTLTNGITLISDAGSNTQSANLQNFIGHTQQ